MVSIEQAKAAQQEMHKTIAEAMKRFSDQTSLKIDEININPIETLGGKISYYIVSTSIHL
jgi:hypothetical protein